MSMLVSTTINGDHVEFACEPDETLLDAYFSSYKLFQCPGIKSGSNVVAALNLKPLHYIVNSLDIPASQSNPFNPSQETLFHKLSSIPQPVQVGYLTEINEAGMKGRSYGNWNIFTAQTTTFNINNQPNAVSLSRMMHEKETRHGGSVNVLFFEGHVEGRKLKPDDSKGVRFKLFSPYSP